MVRSVFALTLICSFSTAYAAQTAKTTKGSKAAKPVSAAPTTTPAAKVATEPQSPSSPNSMSPTASAGYSTEFFCQAPENQSWLTPRIEYIDSQYKYKKSNAKIASNSLIFVTEYERSLAPTVSAGGALKYISKTAKNTDDTGANQKTETNGLKDLEFFLKGYSVLHDDQQVWYGMTLYISPGDSERKDTSANKTKMNGYSGGKKLEPYIGYSKKLSEWTIGGKVFTQLRLGDATIKVTDQNGSSEKINESGGETSALLLFAETPMGNGIGGAYLAYSSTKASDYEANGSTGTSQGGNLAALNLYGTTNLNESSILRGELIYAQIVSDVSTKGGLKSNSTMGLAISARFIF